MLTPWQLVDAESGRAVVETLELADNVWSRALGWQFRRQPLARHGLLLVPCSSIHTCCVRFPIDVGLLDREGRVIGLRQRMRTWRAMLPVRGAFAVLEMPSDGSAMRLGQRLQLLGPEGSRIPKSLQFLDKR